WVPVAGSRVQVDAEGLPRSGSGSATADFVSLPVALFGPLAGTREGWAGTLSGRLDLAGSTAALRARLDAGGSRVAMPVAAGKAAAAERLRLVLDGDLGFAPLSWTGAYALDVGGLDAPGTARAASVRAEGDGRFAGSLATLAGSARVAASAVEIVAAGATLDALALDAAVGDGELRFASFSAAAGERTLSGSGRVLLEPLLAEADLDLRLGGLHAALPEAELTATLRDGTLALAAPRIASAAGPASLDATVPLGALRAVPQLAAALDALPFAPAPGPVSLRLDAPALDSAPLLAALGLAPRPERLRGGLAAELTFEPGSPAAGRGEVRLAGLTVETPDARAAAEGPAVVRLAEGRLELLPVRLRFAGGAVAAAGVELRGGADLDPAWRPLEDPPAALVSRLALDAAGTLDAAVLNPYLAGGAGSGALRLTAVVSGPPDALAAEVRAAGPEASFFWPAPYATRIQAPEAALALRDGRWSLERLRALWNGGTLAVSGGSRPDGGAALAFDLSGVRYRLDYGLSALLSGRLGLELPAAGRTVLSGRLTLDRGLLDRDVDLDRELRDLLFAPEILPGTEESALAALDLDLTVVTADGVRVRNNVADLRAWWQSLAVTGTPELPVVAGRIELDPGGLLFAYGQTVRIDSGALVFTGDPLTDPRVELSTTSSLQDPTIARLRGAESPLDLLDRPEEPSAGLTAGLAGYYGTRVLSRLGESVGLQRVALRPVLVFQEADPSARLDLGRDLSPHASFALSVDLRNAERRTYLLDLHGFRELPGLALQGFVNDEGREGASLQQVLELGGGRPPAQAGPRLRRLRLEAPGGAL
ncbi:MAG TPA: translocation/assembly module TamB domain-containing protein, partial [Thermoanaerobaculia bacterium]|nr:translocation/assembly module TamB domain-containing protein [Thermoanaerobaculia bacterium]